VKPSWTSPSLVDPAEAIRKNRAVDGERRFPGFRKESNRQRSSNSCSCGAPVKFRAYGWTQKKSWRLATQTRGQAILEGRNYELPETRKISLKKGGGGEEGGCLLPQWGERPHRKRPGPGGSSGAPAHEPEKSPILPERHLQGIKQDSGPGGSEFKAQNDILRLPRQVDQSRGSPSHEGEKKKRDGGNRVG